MPVAFGSIKLLEVGANQIGFGSGFDQYLNSVPPKLCRRTSACLSFFVFGKDIMSVIVIYVLYDALWRCFFWMLHSLQMFKLDSHNKETMLNTRILGKPLVIPSYPSPFECCGFQVMDSYIHVFNKYAAVCLFCNPMKKAATEGESVYRWYVSARRHSKAQPKTPRSFNMNFGKKQLMVPKSGR